MASIVLLVQYNSMGIQLLQHGWAGCCERMWHSGQLQCIEWWPLRQPQQPSLILNQLATYSQLWRVVRHAGRPQPFWCCKAFALNSIFLRLVAAAACLEAVWQAKRSVLSIMCAYLCGMGCVGVFWLGI